MGPAQSESRTIEAALCFSRCSSRRSPRPATPRRSRGCAASGGSTRSPRPGCARKSATSRGSRSPRCSRGSLGWVPSEHTSDEERAQGQITKAGPPHTRRLLVEFASGVLAWRSAGGSRVIGAKMAVSCRCGCRWRRRLGSLDRGGAGVVLLGSVGAVSERSAAAGGCERLELLERGEQVAGPGPGVLEVQLGFAAVEREAAGDVQELVAQPLGIGLRELSGQQQCLGPDEQVVRASRFAAMPRCARTL